MALGARQDSPRTKSASARSDPDPLIHRDTRREVGGGSTVCPPLSTARAPAAPAEARVTRDLVGAPTPFRDDLHFLSPSLLFLKLESTNSVGTRLTPGQPRVTPGFSRGDRANSSTGSSHPGDDLPRSFPVPFPSLDSY